MAVLVATGPCWMHAGIFAFDPDRGKPSTFDETDTSGGQVQR